MPTTAKSPKPHLVRDESLADFFPLLSLEPELFELVAHQLNKSSIANLRLVSKACKANTNKTFKEKCCSEIRCLLWDEESLRLLVELSGSSIYGPVVRMVTIVVNEYPEPDAPRHFTKCEYLGSETFELCLSSRKVYDALRASNQDLQLLQQAFTNFKDHGRLETIFLDDEQHLHTQCGAVRRLPLHLWSEAFECAPVERPLEGDRRPFELVIHALAASTLQLRSLIASPSPDGGLEWCVNVGDAATSQFGNFYQDLGSVCAELKFLMLDVWLRRGSEIDGFCEALCSPEKLKILALYIKNGDDYAAGIGCCNPDVDSRIIRKVMELTLPTLTTLEIKCTTYVRERMKRSDLRCFVARNKNLDTLELEGLELVGFENATSEDAEDRLEEFLDVKMELFDPVF